MSNSNICPKCHQARVRLSDGTRDCGCYVSHDEYPEGYPDLYHGHDYNDVDLCRRGSSHEITGWTGRAEDY